MTLGKIGVRSSLGSMFLTGVMFVLVKLSREHRQYHRYYRRQLLHNHEGHVHHHHIIMTSSNSKQQLHQQQHGYQHSMPQLSCASGLKKGQACFPGMPSGSASHAHAVSSRRTVTCCFRAHDHVTAATGPAARSRSSSLPWTRTPTSGQRLPFPCGKRSHPAAYLACGPLVAHRSLLQDLGSGTTSSNQSVSGDGSRDSASRSASRGQFTRLPPLLGPGLVRRKRVNTNGRRHYRQGKPAHPLYTPSCYGLVFGGGGH